MTTPTPGEIAAALDVLRRVPGVGGRSCLHDIAVDIRPDRLMARDVRAWAIRKGTDLALMADPEIADDLDEIAARHGLRITCDPGDIVGYAEVGPRRNGEPGYSLVDEVGTWQPDDLDMAWADVAATGHLLVALHLVPKGGQS
ncbi:hypothetical protein [Nocardia salmonicida]|uniref:hypothetical protein n=1 Tax=Nocardia salmonicida TaxID=53431 RepID=UPI0037B16EBC